MKRYWMLLASLFAFVTLCGCASVSTGSTPKIFAQIDDVATGALETLPAVFELNGQPVFLYTTKDNRVVFRRGDQVIRVDENARVKGGTRYQLHMQDNHLQAFWWSHQDGKNLYTTASTDGGQAFGPVSMVNEDYGVLPFFSVIQGQQGVTGVSYLDERKPTYQAYLNRSTNFGLTWPKNDQRLDIPPSDGHSSFVRDPQTVALGAMWVSAWEDSVHVNDQTSYRIVSRYSEDTGLTWSVPVVVYSGDTLISSLKLQVAGQRIVIAGDEHSKGIFNFHSPDQGRTWLASGYLANTGFPQGTEGASNSGLSMTVYGDQGHFVWMQDRKGEKTRIMRASYDFAQSRWVDGVQRLDIKASDNTRSISPEVMAAPSGAIIAAWVDYRDIRPGIYLSASFDQGKAWTAPQPLLKPGEVSAGWPRLMAWKDQLAIGYEIYPNDRMADGKFVLQGLPLVEGNKSLPVFQSQTAVSESYKKKRLEQRVNTLWEGRVAGNYKDTYEMFDFAYRSSTPSKFYLDNIGTITYLSFSVGDSTIDGNEAKVNAKLKYEVKQTMLPTGKPIKIEPVDVDITNTWVWVANDWYLVYSPSYDQPILKY
jgi:hypothetical protein